MKTKETPESSNFYIQSGYTGKEVSALMFSLDRSRLRYSAVHDYDKDWPVVGSVEFVEQMLRKQFKPDYYPFFLESWLHRKVGFSNYIGDNTEPVFVKPADRHKRFESFVFWPTENWQLDYIDLGPICYSELVKFEDEWRYYVADGEVLVAHWYQGPEVEIDPPELGIGWPKDFCGAVDFGRLDNGKIALVENNLPYACGWYGSCNDGEVYGEWLSKGFKYLKYGRV